MLCNSWVVTPAIGGQEDSQGRLVTTVPEQINFLKKHASSMVCRQGASGRLQRCLRRCDALVCSVLHDRSLHRALQVSEWDWAATRSFERSHPFSRWHH